MTLGTFRSAALAVFLAALTTSVCAQPQITIVGAGTQKSCGTWLDRRKNEQEESMAQWAAGFMSGGAYYKSGMNPFDGTDYNGFLYWLDDYCRHIPTAAFVDAVTAFAVFRDNQQRAQR